MKRKISAINVEINMPNKLMRRKIVHCKRSVNFITNFILHDPIDKINIHELDIPDMTKLSAVLEERINKYMNIKGFLDETRFIYT